MESTTLLSKLESFSSLDVLIYLAVSSILVLFGLQNILAKHRSTLPVQFLHSLAHPIIEQNPKPTTTTTCPAKSFRAPAPGTDITRRPPCLPHPLFVELQSKISRFRTSSTYSETSTRAEKVRIATSPVEESEWEEPAAPITGIKCVLNVIPLPPPPPVPVFLLSAPSEDAKPKKSVPLTTADHTPNQRSNYKLKADLHVALVEAIRKRRPACDLSKVDENDVEADEDDAGWDVVVGINPEIMKKDVATVAEGWLSSASVVAGVSIVAAVGVVWAIKTGRFSRR